MNREELERKFEVLYKNKITPRAQRLEEDKLNQKRTNNHLKGAGCIMPILMLIMIVLCNKISPDILSPEKSLTLKIIMVFLFVSIIIIFVFIIIISNNNWNKTETIFTEIKELIQQPILSLFGNFNITNDEVITLEEIQNIGLYNFAMQKEDNDTLMGTSTNNAEVSISVTELFHENETGHQRIPDFEGLIFKANIKRKNKCNIIVTENNCEIGLPEDFVLLDNVESKYMIYSNNKNEAERIITSYFIKIITEIEKIFCPTSLNFILKDEYLYLFLNSIICNNEEEEECTNGDNPPAFYPKFFEIGYIGTNILEKELYKKAFSELYSLFSLIDHFKLNQKTGL